MSQENVEIVRRFLIVVDVDEALTYADPGIVWNRSRSCRRKDTMRFGRAWRVGKANGTTTR